MNEDIGKEPEGIPGAPTAAAIAGIIGFVWLCAGVIWLFYPASSPANAPRPVPGPGLEVAPVADHDAYAAHQRALLAGAGDRIPIEEAMAAIVRRGTLEPGHETEAGQ